MKYEGIVLVSDVDGTLIDEENKVPQRNVEAIERFQAQGGKLILATGRIPEAVLPVLEFVTPDYPCICHNGCSIYDFKEKRYIETTPLSREAILPAGEMMAQFPASGVEIMTVEGIYVVKQNPATDRHLTFEKITAKYVDTFEEVTPTWLKILFAQETEETDVIIAKMEHSPYHGQYSIMRTHNYYYEIFDKKASKGDALKSLCRRLGVALKQVYAIGDNDNDLAMLKAAGVSAAAGNAADHVKHEADFVVCSNTEGAVAEFIETISCHK